MKNPPSWRAITLGLVTAILLACKLIAKPEDPVGTNSTGETQAPLLLLADVWNASIDPTGWWMSEKYDGLRGYWDGQKLWSRKGQVIHAPGYFLAELPRDIALDGELWIGRGKFEETVSTVRSETPDDRWKKVRFMVFDAPQAKGNFEERMQFLRTTLSETNPFVRVVAQERCRGVTQLLAERDRVVRMGGEGLMLRQPESQYEPRRSPTLLKVKPYDDAEATVIAHEPASQVVANVDRTGRRLESGVVDEGHVIASCDEVPDTSRLLMRRELARPRSRRRRPRPDARDRADENSECECFLHDSSCKRCSLGRTECAREDGADPWT